MGRRIASLRTLGAVALIIGAVALLMGLAIVLIKLGPQWLTDTQGLSPTERDEARGRTRTALFALLAGVIALVGAFYTARTFALNRRGQITERFTRAIDQLGDDKVEIRLGGIYALERIAHESSDEHGPIIEVLTAYVRENSPWPPRHRPDPVGGGGASRVDPDNEEAEITEQEDSTPPEAAVDIKAILTVLRRRNLQHEDDLFRVNLTRANLSTVREFDMPLRRAMLYAAQLQYVNLPRANLQGAFLSDAQLGRATLFHAQLQRAHLHGATLQEAFLNGAKLQGADLRWADLHEAHLPETDLREGSCRTRTCSRRICNARTSAMPSCRVRTSAARRCRGRNSTARSAMVRPRGRMASHGETPG